MKFSTKKMGVNFFPAKKTKPGGGGSEGGLVKDHTFAAFFFVHPSLISIHWAGLVQRKGRGNSGKYLLYDKTAGR